MNIVLMTAKEASELVGVTISTINEWKQKGWLKPCQFDRSKVGRPIGLYNREDVLQASVRRKLIKEQGYKPPVRLDEETHACLLRIIGQAAIEGVRLSMRHVIVGALKQLTDEQLLIVAKAQIVQTQ